MRQDSINSVFNAIKDKVFFSCHSNVMVEVVEELPEKGEAGKAYFDGMSLLDCVEDIEDDIQQVSSITEEGVKVNLEDYYQKHGVFDEDNTRFISALNKLMTRDLYTIYKHYRDILEDENLPLDTRIKEWFKNQDPDVEYTLNADGLVDVIGNINIGPMDLVNGHLPFKFGKVKGWFDADDSDLTSLWGSPKEVTDYFSFMDCAVESLDGCPRKVGGVFECTGNKLVSLKGCPEEVGGDFMCFDNRLESLEGCPEIVHGDFNCSNNPLTSLKGGPREVSGDYNCSDCCLQSLEGAPTKVGGDFDCSYNGLTTLEGASAKIGGEIINHNYDEKELCDE